MSRLLGPRVREMRALGVDLPGLSRKSIERRPYPPGQHGQSRRRKLSDYALRLREKQKLRLNYGLGERQFSNLFRLASRSSANPGERLLALLEQRLDNVVFRAGFARTIPAARQLVGHGHVLVDGKRVDRAGYRVRAGQLLTIAERSRTLDIIQSSLLAPIEPRPRWLEVDKEAVTARIIADPDADAVLVPVDVRLVVEYYAQRG
jgi:small subunit ribosomal protein S4